MAHPGVVGTAAVIYGTTANSSDLLRGIMITAKYIRIKFVIGIGVVLLSSVLVLALCVAPLKSWILFFRIRTNPTAVMLKDLACGSPAHQLPPFFVAHALANSNSEIRVWTAIYLYKRGDRRTAIRSTLLDVIKASNIRARVTALSFFVEIYPDDNEGRKAVVYALDDTNSLVRATAISILARSPGNSAEKFMRINVFLSDHDSLVRQSALEGMGHLGTNAIPALMQMLSVEDALLRMGALLSLEHVSGGIHKGDLNYLNLCEVVVRESDIRVRKAMRRLITKIETEGRDGSHRNK